MAAVLDITNHKAEVNRNFQKDIVCYKRVQDAVEFSISELENTYLPEHEIEGGRYKEASCAMLGKKSILDEAIVKSELKTVEDVTEPQLCDLIRKYVKSSRTTLDTVSPSFGRGFMHGARDAILKFKSTSSKNSLAKRIIIFGTCFSGLQMHDPKQQTCEEFWSMLRVRNRGRHARASVALWSARVRLISPVAARAQG